MIGQIVFGLLFIGIIWLWAMMLGAVSTARTPRRSKREKP